MSLTMFLSQLLSYNPITWAIFIAISFCAARYLLGWGIPLGHIAVAFIVTILDVQWIQSEIHKPGWSGTPDQDFIFHIGLFLRVILINTTLLPISAFGFWLRRRSEGQLKSAAA